MSGALATNRLKAVEGNQFGSGRIKPVLTDKPDLRLIRLGYFVPLILLAAGVLAILLPISDAARFSISFAIVIVLGGTLTFFLSSHARLRTASYTITDEYIEAQTGTFEKTTQRIPISYIRDVTHRQNFFQTLFAVSDIKVTATNGDSVRLENVSEGIRKREIIWDLVLSRSPGASR